jgi:hypothetical protein
MTRAITKDIIGSGYELKQIKKKEFSLFHPPNYDNTDKTREAIRTS